MAKHYNLARMTTATTGTGTITLGSAATGFLTFAAAGAANGDVLTYAIEDGSNREVGVGTYTSSGTTLARTTILSSTNSNAAISLSGSAQVFSAISAQDLALAGLTDTLISSPTNGQLLQWNGTVWVPYTPPLYEFGPFAPPLPAWFDFATYKNAALTVTATTQTKRGMQVQYTGATAHDQVSLGVRSVAAWTTPWTVTARIKNGPMLGSYPTIGLAMLNSTSLKTQAACAQTAGTTVVGTQGCSWLIQQRPSQSAYTGNVYQVAAAENPIWYRLGYDGTNQTYSMSTDGFNWEVYSVTQASSYINPVTHVGIYMTGWANIAPSPGVVGCLVTYWDDPDYPYSGHLG